MSSNTKLSPADGESLQTTPRVLALFGPTSVGKTGVAIQVARLLRSRGLDPVAVNCDSIQIYRGLEVISGAATATERQELEHRLVGGVDPREEMTAGRYSLAAHREIDSLLEEQRMPLVVGGTGLWLRAALADLQMTPPPPAQIVEGVEREMASQGPAALHAALPRRFAVRVHPNDRNRIARWTALIRSGTEPHLHSTDLWTSKPRHSTRLIGLIVDRRDLAERIDSRVEEMASAARAEALSLAALGPSRTARAAIGLEGFVDGDLEKVKAEHRAYAKRQITWMRKMPGVQLIDRTGWSDYEVAEEIVEAL